MKLIKMQTLSTRRGWSQTYGKKREYGANVVYTISMAEKEDSNLIYSAANR